MAGVRTNEGATRLGERTGTRAQARYLRVSASKAREVLDLIRGKDVERADGVLRFTERGVAKDVRKILASAVANAQHNDSQDPAELKVVACFADEGPTLRRFRPRARGRATRIRKRTCHITVIVGRMTEAELEHKRRKEEAVGVAAGRARGGAATRRARVAKSRQAAETTRRRGKAEETPTEEAVEEATTEAVSDEARDEDAPPRKAPATRRRRASEASETEDAEPEASETDTGLHPYGEGSHVALEDDSEPEGYPIKGNANSMLYHTPESPFYGRTVAEVWFATEADAEVAGFSKPASQQTDDDPEEQS
jgi:large subunit ribosomal protein L22